MLTSNLKPTSFVSYLNMVFFTKRPSIPGDAIKRDPERENLAVLTIAAQTVNVIHIRVTLNAVTR